MLSRKTCGLLDFGLVVPGPGDPGRRKVGSEARLPGDGGRDFEVTGKRGGEGLGWTPEVFRCGSEGTPKPGLPVVSEMRSRGLQGAGGGGLGLSRRAGSQKRLRLLD